MSLAHALSGVERVSQRCSNPWITKLHQLTSTSYPDAHTSDMAVFESAPTAAQRPAPLRLPGHVAATLAVAAAGLCACVGRAGGNAVYQFNATGAAGDGQGYDTSTAALTWQGVQYEAGVTNVFASMASDAK